MSGFEYAFVSLLEREGGYNNLTFDYGLATNFGISLRFAQRLPLSDVDVDGDGHITQEDIRELTEDDAEHIYRVYFWDYYKLDNINSASVAAKAFHLFVNMRGRNAGKILQRACRACGHTLVEDGLIGSKSFAGINSLDENILFAAICSEAAGFYRCRVAEDVDQKPFLKGWLNRAYARV